MKNANLSSCEEDGRHDVCSMRIEPSDRASYKEVYVCMYACI